MDYSTVKRCENYDDSWKTLRPESVEYIEQLGSKSPDANPFDETAVDFLETLNVPCFKVVLFENTDLPLIRRIAATGKLLILSTGMATVAELDEAVRAAREAGCQNLVLLKCTSTYPRG